MNKEHSYFVNQAITIAQKGSPKAFPNPLVGCVIVHNNEVVASGYHQKYGEAHAEVNAIQALPPGLPPSDCTLYVTLEPCSHHGKTPPCADLIISKGFKKVVIAAGDPNPLVGENGIKKLKEAGIEVITGIVEDEARLLNRRFYTFYEKKRPYYILKWAQTADGFISRIPFTTKEENKITGQEAQVFVHRLRAETIGIFVGKNTVLNDNPELTTRYAEGASPVRIFIDKNLEVPSHFNVFNNKAQTIVFNAEKHEENGHINYIKLDFNKANVLKQINEKLYQLKIQSVLVEGGTILLENFLKEGFGDEILVFENPELYFKKGLKAPLIELKNDFELVGRDRLYRF